MYRKIGKCLKSTNLYKTRKHMLKRTYRIPNIVPNKNVSVGGHSRVPKYFEYIQNNKVTKVKQKKKKHALRRRQIKEHAASN